MKDRRLVYLITLLGTGFVSCMNVEAYQQMYVNDEKMALEAQKLEQFETNFETYREAAAGANNGKVGAGCGCN